MKQITALSILKMGKNVFLTGSAGSGKTFVLNQYLHYLRARQIQVAMTASTGIAATHMNGMTIHGWSGMGILDSITAKDIARIRAKVVVRERIINSKVLVIDEISMLHLKQLNVLNEILQQIRESELPFGGIQLIVAGDFFQLPPVGNPDESNREKFAFMSQAWLDADFQICYLNEQHRQSNIDDNQEHNCYYGLDLTAILNQIRQQKFTDKIIPALQATMQHQVLANRTRLYTHNFNVDKINQQELANIEKDSHHFYSWQEGDEKLVENIKKTLRTTEELSLKVGAKVMFIRNNPDLNVSNGTLGVVVDFQTNSQADKDNVSETEKFPVVRLNDGREILVEYDVWQIEDEEGDVLAAYYQIPLTLAWAITVHKSQGMTLDAAEIDLSKTFELGQGYVALSRLRNLSGLKLLGFNELSLQLDPLARGADQRFLVLSKEHEAAFFALPNDEIEQQQKGFILKNGGTLNHKKIQAYEKRLQAKQQILQQKNHQQQAKDLDGQQLSTTLLKTKLLLDEGFSIAEIADARQLAQSTIMGHIQKLQTLIDDLAIEHLRPDEMMFSEIQNAYQMIKRQQNLDDQDETGKLKIRPIFEQLKEKYSYNQIRLAMLFLD